MAETTTPRVADHYQLYCMQVGHLFTAFARLETLLTGCLKLHLAENIRKPEDVRGIKNERPDVSAGPLAGALHALGRGRNQRPHIVWIKSTGKPDRDWLEAIFAQVGHLESLRDKIAPQPP
jgi:hypothetical protein